MKLIYVKDIKPGDKVEDKFLVTGKNMAYSQKGSPYLSLKLRDRTGEIEGRIWENAAELDKKFKKGEIVQANCRAISFKNILQLSITNVLPATEPDCNPVDYLSVSRFDIEKMFSGLKGFADSVENPSLKKLLANFLAEQTIMDKLKKVPAAKGMHHVCIGGLLEHTLSVVHLLDMMARHYKGVNRDLLIAGGILHDIGKTRELSANGLIDYTDEGRMIGHIVIGLEMVNERIARYHRFS